MTLRDVVDTRNFVTAMSASTPLANAASGDVAIQVNDTTQMTGHVQVVYYADKKTETRLTVHQLGGKVINEMVEPKMHLTHLSPDEVLNEWYDMAHSFVKQLSA